MGRAKSHKPPQMLAPNKAALRTVAQNSREAPVHRLPQPKHIVPKIFRDVRPGFRKPRPGSPPIHLVGAGYQVPTAPQVAETVRRKPLEEVQEGRRPKRLTGRLANTRLLLHDIRT